MQTKFNEMKAKWEKTKKTQFLKYKNFVKTLKRVNGEIEKAERNYELNKAAELKYGKLPELQKRA